MNTYKYFKCGNERFRSMVMKRFIINNSRASVSGLIVLVIVLVASSCLKAYQKPAHADIDTVIKEWSYTDNELSRVRRGDGNIRIIESRIKIDESYEATLEKVAAFYSKKCGSSKNYAKPEVIIPFDKINANDGTESIIGTFHINEKDIMYVHGDELFTIMVLLRPSRNNSVEIIMAVHSR